MAKTQHRPRLTIVILRDFAVGMLVVYLGWNIAWLCTGNAPPSLMVGLTGLPAPTTGCTRSWLALRDGHRYDALMWNPLTVPLTALLVFTVAWLALQAIRRQRLRLPSWLVWTWGGMLLTAWIVKFVLGPAYW